MNNEEYREEDAKTRLARMSSMLGAGMSAERKNEIYFGGAPKGTYPKHTDLAHIHDLRLSAKQKKDLYGIGEVAEEVVEGRLYSDSKAGLIQELVEQSSFTKREAEEFVKAYMIKNNLVEKVDPVLGKYLAPRD